MSLILPRLKEFFGNIIIDQSAGAPEPHLVGAIFNRNIYKIAYKWYANVEAAKADESFSEFEYWTWPTVSGSLKLTRTAPVLRVIAFTEEGFGDEAELKEIGADSIVTYNVKPAAPASATFTAAAANATMDHDTAVIVGLTARFTVKTTVAADDEHDYAIAVTLTALAGTYQDEDMKNAKDTSVAFNGLTSGMYKVHFAVNTVDPVTGAYNLHTDTTLYIKMVEPSYVDPTFAVAPATKRRAGSIFTGYEEVDVVSEMNADTVVFKGMPVFTMTTGGELAEGDVWSNYQIEGKLYTKEAYDAQEAEISSYYYEAEGEHTAEFTDAYNGAYVVVFALNRSNGTKVEDTVIYFQTTEFAAPVLPIDPVLTVTPEGEYKVKNNGTVLFNEAAFKLTTTGELIEGDSLGNYTITAELYTLADYTATGEDFAAPTSEEVWEANDTVEGGYILYKPEVEEGEYVVRFFHTRTNGFMPDILEGEVEVFFNVVSEPVADIKVLTVKAVDAKKVEDTLVFTENVAFDMFVSGLKSDDNLKLRATVYTVEEYDGMAVVDPHMLVAAADSVRFAIDSLKAGKYVALFELVGEARGEETIVDDIVYNIEVEVEPVVGAIESGELAGVNVYPNPNAGTFNVVVPERARIEIFGLNGAKVLSREVNAGVEAFNLTHSGIYFVRVMAGNKTAVKRVVVR